MEYKEALENSKNCLGKYCKACLVCDGKACKNSVPGPGAKGLGDTAIRNYDKWQEIRLNMDTLCENKKICTELEIFGKKFKYPFFAGPVGAVTLHYGDKYNDLEYNEILVSACAEAGIAAFTGDGTNPKVMSAACASIKKRDGIGIPTVKPWNKELLLEKLAMIKEANPFALAMDIDAAGLPFLKTLAPPAGRKSQEELTEIIKEAGLPFIVKGIMTAKAALKAKNAGASAIIVSNHGGRVLDQCAATSEVLSEIVNAVRNDTPVNTKDKENGGMKILVDGGIRSGTTVFKALALGADAVVICRPFVPAVYGGAADGVKSFITKIASELEDTMSMCGAASLSQITRDMVRLPNEMWRN